MQVTPNAVERSQIVWYRLPSVGGSIQGGEVGRFSGVATAGNGCSLEFAEHTEEEGNTAICSEVPNRRDIVDLVAAQTGDIYKTDANQFTERVVECLKDVDSNWGRSIRGDNTVREDIAAYHISGGNGSPCNVDIVINHNTSNALPSWQTPVQFQNNPTTWRSVTGSCVVDLPIPCTQEQEENGFLTIDNACVPRCFRLDFYQNDGSTWGNIGDAYYELYGDTLQHVSIGSDDQCNGEAVDTSYDFNNDNDPDNDKKNEELYNILPITAQKTEFDSCCRRSKKTECPTNYESKTVANQPGCYPNCAQAAEFAGYNQNNQTQTDEGKACNLTTRNGQDAEGDWKPVPDFYDPYNFKTLDSLDVITDNNRLCCVKKSRP